MNISLGGLASRGSVFAEKAVIRNAAEYSCDDLHALAEPEEVGLWPVPSKRNDDSLHVHGECARVTRRVLSDDGVKHAVEARVEANVPRWNAARRFS